MSLHREGPAPAPPPETAVRRPLAFGLRTLLLLVGVFAAVFLCARAARDAAVPAYQWMRLLHEGEPEQRREAAVNLGNVRGTLGDSLRPQIAGALIASLGDPDADVVADSLRSLAFQIEAETDPDQAREWTSAPAAALRDPAAVVAGSEGTLCTASNGQTASPGLHSNRRDAAMFALLRGLKSDRPEVRKGGGEDADRRKDQS